MEVARFETLYARAKHREMNQVTTKPLFAQAQPDDAGLTAAFNHYLRTGKPNDDISQLRNAQGVGTGSSGGYTVPEGFRQKLVDRLKAYGGVAGLAEEVTTSTGNNLPWPTIDDTANVGEIVAEHGTFASGADLVFGEQELGAYRYAAGGAGSTPIRVSVELAQDSGIDIEGLVIDKLATRIGRVQAVHLATGTGTGQPLGILTGRTGVQTADIAAGIGFDDLLDFVHSVDPAYRENASWIFNDRTLQVIRGIKDSAGDPLWRPSTADMGTMVGGGSLLGYPVTIDQAFPDFDPDSTTVNWGVFGDIRAGYVVRRVRDVVIVVDPWGRAHHGEIQFSAWARMDATQQDVNAYSALTGAAA
jgi:HK97 family phage major capsid protein